LQPAAHLKVPPETLAEALLAREVALSSDSSTAANEGLMLQVKTNLEVDEGFSKAGSNKMSKSIWGSLTLLLMCVGLAISGDRKIIRPEGTKPGGSWSHGILVDGTLYVSGMGGETPAGAIPGDFESEVRQSLDNVGAVLKLAGMSASDVVSVQVYITDSAYFERMNNVYKAFFKDPRPARTTVVVSKLVGAGHIEITATARK
jgi:2-iminobutanoate/2-iminopropanoate deaminase